MKRKTLLLIALAVAAGHVAFFWYISDKKPLPERAYIPPPNFVARHGAYVDPESGEKTIYREFTVSTKLPAPPSR